MVVTVRILVLSGRESFMLYVLESCGQMEVSEVWKDEKFRI